MDLLLKLDFRDHLSSTGASYVCLLTAGFGAVILLLWRAT